MNVFSEFITRFSNNIVRVCTYHKIYGNQKAIINNFKPFYTEDRIGFLINEREVFMYLNEIENVELNMDEFIINGALQKMVVKLI